MVPWYWVPVALVVGSLISVLFIGICATNSRNEKDGWWDDE